MDRVRHRIVPVWLPHAGCRGTCIFCDQRSIQGSAPAPEDLDDTGAGGPGALSVAMCRLAPSTGGGTVPELAFFGGTFTALPPEAQRLLLSQAAQLKSSGEISGIRISTHPLHVTTSQLRLLREHGVDTVELGIQSFEDQVLHVIGRGYHGQRALAACQSVRAFGFRLVVQLMQFLPGASLDHDLASGQVTCDLSPDGVRLFPTVVLRGTVLAQWWTEGRYVPATVDDASRRCGRLVHLLEGRGVPVIRVGLQSSKALKEACLAGPLHPALGEMARAAALAQLVEELAKAHQVPGAVLLVRRELASLFTGHGGWGASLLSPTTSVEIAGRRRWSATEPASRVLACRGVWEVSLCADGTTMRIRRNPVAIPAV